MRVEMAYEASLEFLQEGGTVRLAMAGGALGNEPVAAVAHGTCELAVLALCGLPFGVFVFVAAAANGRVGIAVVRDLQRCVSRMACEAVFHLQLWQMRRMAVEAGRDLAVHRVAVGTSHLGVGTWKFGELLGLGGVAFPAGTGQEVIHGYLERGVGVGVTLKTMGELLAMRGLFVTAEALGHQLRPVVFDRIVIMKLEVATVAIKLVLSAGLFEIFENISMALAALGYGEGRRHHGIEILAGWLIFAETEGGGGEHHQEGHRHANGVFHGFPTYTFRL